MKNWGYRIIVSVSAAAALIAAGCSRVTPDIVPIAKETLCCRPVANQLTRAEVNTDPWLKGMTFKGWAYTLPEGSSWNRNSNEAICIADGEKFQSVGVDSLWYSESRKTWTSEETVSLFAISPEDGDYSFDRAGGIVVNDFDILSEVDLRYATPSLDNTMANHTWFVPIVFKHARCKVDIRINTVGSQSSIIVKRVSLLNLVRRGDFIVNKETWSVDYSNTIRRDFKIDEEGLAIKPQKIVSLEEYPIWCLPQNLTRSCFEVEYLVDLGNGFATEKVLRTQNFTGKWETGRHYTYNLNIREDSVNYKDIDFDYEF